eukprot:m.48642 g.48642  ORF g.48642 m.48642 type:complete len:537 (-) comp11052_c0_seq1:427-2037(-)
MASKDSSVCVGVSCGNTNGVVCLGRDGKVDVVSNAGGDRYTPCTVGYQGSEVVVGRVAKQSLVRNSRNTIDAFWRAAGHGLDDDITSTCLRASKTAPVSESENGLTFTVSDGDGNEKVVPLAEPMQYICGALHASATEQAHTTVKSIVASLPVTATKQTEEMIRAAWAHHGVTVQQFVSDPISAAVAYRFGQEQHHRAVRANAVVVHIGGTQACVSVVSSLGGVLQVLGSKSSATISGKSYDKVISKILSQEFFRKTKCDIMDDKRAQVKLLHASEVAKKALTRQTAAQVSIDGLFEGMDLHCSVPRVKFESLASSVTNQISVLVDEVLGQVGIDKEQVSVCILSGGQCCMPKIQQAFESMFGKTKVLSSIAPDEVVAIGACQQAIVLAEADDEDEEEDDLEDQADGGSAQCVSTHALRSAHTISLCGVSKTIGIQTGDTVTPIVPSGTPVPFYGRFQLQPLEGESSVDVVLMEEGDDGTFAKAAELVLVNMGDVATSPEGTNPKRAVLHIEVMPAGSKAMLTDASNSKNTVTVDL